MGRAAKWYALGLGSLLLIVGVAWWVPSLTWNGLMLGLFFSKLSHDLVYLLAGLAGILVSLLKSTQLALWYIGILGAIAGVVALLGFLQGSTPTQLLPVNLGDNVAYALLGLISLCVFLIAWRGQVQAAIALSRAALEPPK
jgi:hypothetical protein